MLNLLVDTSTWLDLAKRRDGQRQIVPLRVFSHQNKVKLLVPSVVIDEFKRNRPRIEHSMTASVSERLRLIKRDLDDSGGAGVESAVRVLDELAHQVPLIGAMTTRNFDEILELLTNGQQIEPTDDERSRVVQRGLDKVAPFHRSRNSVADALLIELYASASGRADLSTDPHGFVTSNSDDFSTPQGDKRQPHPDLANIFGSDPAMALPSTDWSRSSLRTSGMNLRSCSQRQTSSRSPAASTRSKKRRTSSSTGSGTSAPSIIWLDSRTLVISRR